MVILVPITKKILFSHKTCILHLLTIHGQQQEPVKLPPMKKKQTHQRVVVASLSITSSLEKQTGSPDEGIIFLSEDIFNDDLCQSQSRRVGGFAITQCCCCIVMYALLAAIILAGIMATAIILSMYQREQSRMVTVENALGFFVLSYIYIYIYIYT